MSIVGADGKPVGNVNMGLQFENPELVQLFNSMPQPDPRLMAMLIQLTLKVDRIGRTLALVASTLDRLEKSNRDASVYSNDTLESGN